MFKTINFCTFTNTKKRTYTRAEYVYSCDQCDLVFTRKRKINSKTQYCTINCVTIARSKNGALNRELEATNMLRYGTARPTQNNDIDIKRKITCIERYDKSNVMNVTSIKEKSIDNMRKTFDNKYGVDHPMKIETNVQKANISREKTCIKRYGVKNILLVPKFIAKKDNTCLKKYGFKNPMQNKNISKKMIETRKANIIPYSPSKEELEVLYYLRDNFGNDDVVHSRWCLGWPIDFYIKSINTYVQYDGSFYHTHDPVLRKRFEWLDKNFHRDVLQNETFANAGERLVRITFDDFFVVGKNDKSFIIDVLKKI